MAVLITSDLQKIGINAIFQPVEFNTLITKIDDTYDYDCVLLGNYSDTGTDPVRQHEHPQIQRLRSLLVSAGRKRL